jgi:HTH-type transcriptional regulator/antitoxin HigA
MIVKAKYRLKAATRDSYLELVTRFPLASIQSDDHLHEAQKVIDRLLAKGRLDKGEDLYLDALSDLVASYEDEHHAVEPASDADMLAHLMNAKGINQIRLSREAMIPKSTISELLAGKKRLTRQLIHKLSTYFDVDPGILTSCY